MGGGTDLARNQADIVLLSGRLARRWPTASAVPSADDHSPEPVVVFRLHFTAAPRHVEGLVTPWMAGSACRRVRSRRSQLPCACSNVPAEVSIMESLYLLIPLSPFVSRVRDRGGVLVVEKRFSSMTSKDQATAS